MVDGRTAWREWRGVVVTAARMGGGLGWRVGIRIERIGERRGQPARRVARVGKVGCVLLVVLETEGAHEAGGVVVLFELLGGQNKCWEECEDDDCDDNEHKVGEVSLVACI
jgi:hypothetical protein